MKKQTKKTKRFDVEVAVLNRDHSWHAAMYNVKAVNASSAQKQAETKALAECAKPGYELVGVTTVWYQEV